MSYIKLTPNDTSLIANPYPTYDKLRQSDPIHYRPKQDDWILTRHADVKFVLRDKRFEFPELVDAQDERLVGWQQLFQPPLNGTKLMYLRQKCQRQSNLWIVNRCPMDHARIKGAIFDNFLPQALESFRPHIKSIADQLIDSIQTEGSTDIVAAFASPLPIQVMCQFLQIPSEELLREFDQWGKVIMNTLEMDATVATREQGLMATMGLTQHVHDVIVKRQSTQQRNPLNSLIRAHQREELSEDELLANGTFLLLAGIITTQSLIAKGLWALLHHPRQKELLQAGPQLLGSTIEECLRYAPPTHFTTRVANDNVVIKSVNVGEQTIQKGQKVRLALAAANRDPEVFCEPERFDITRVPNPHLSFGYGRHVCIGAYLARMQAQIAIDTVFKRLPDLAFATDQTAAWETGLRSHALKSLPVIF